MDLVCGRAGIWGGVLDHRAPISNPIPHILQLLNIWMKNVGEEPTDAENTEVLKLDKEIEEGELETERHFLNKILNLSLSPTNQSHEKS